MLFTLKKFTREFVGKRNAENRSTFVPVCVTSCLVFYRDTACCWFAAIERSASLIRFERLSIL